MTQYTLHCFAQSGNAYKPGLMLSLLDADWTPIFVDFFNGATRAPAYRAINEMGEVPVLTHGATRISQSGVILSYLCGRHDAFGPGPDARDGTDAAAREIQRWILWDNHKLTANIATARFMMNFLDPAKRNAEVIAFLLARARAALKVLEARLESQDWVATDSLSIADLSCVGYLYFAEEFEVDMAGFPAIKAWLDRIAALPGWAHPYQMMPGHPLPGQPA